MTDEVFRTRVSKVRFTSGLSLINMPTPDERDRKRCLQDMAETIRQSDDIAGWAIVIWGPDGSSTASMGVPRSNIPSILVPEFVKSRLLAYRIESWTIETVNDAWAGA